MKERLALRSLARFTRYASWQEAWAEAEPRQVIHLLGHGLADAPARRRPFVGVVADVVAELLRGDPRQALPVDVVRAQVDEALAVARRFAAGEAISREDLERAAAAPREDGARERIRRLPEVREDPGLGPRAVWAWWAACAVIDLAHLPVPTGIRSLLRSLATAEVIDEERAEVRIVEALRARFEPDLACLPDLEDVEREHLAT